MTRLTPSQLRCYLVIQTDALLPGRSLADTLTLALQGGVTIVQLREKTASTKEFVALAALAKEICSMFNVPLLINDRLDVALAVKADGVHIGQDDMPIATARQLLGEQAIIGISARTSEEATQAVNDGADYLGIGPCYPTTSKSDAKAAIGPRGVATILQSFEDSAVPAVTIGGVNGRNAARVMHGAVTPKGQGLAGIAVVSAIATAQHPDQAASQVLSAVDAFNAAHWPVSLPDTMLCDNTISQSLQEVMRQIWDKTRSDGQVVQQITNTVVQNDSANATLALSCSPIMSSYAEEAADLSRILGALCINLGTLTDAQVQGMHAAGQAANANRKPVICDPVGCGASHMRRLHTDEILNSVQFTCIKGNAGEIASIAGVKGASSKGVDSSGALEDAGRVVANLARRERCIVAITGKIDYISDGQFIAAISSGHPLLGQITGSGCLTGSAMGCFAGSAALLDNTPFGLTTGNQFVAAILAISTVCVAGEIAAERPDVHGPGSFRSALLDSLASITLEDVVQRAKISITKA